MLKGASPNSTYRQVCFPILRTWSSAVLNQIYHLLARIWAKERGIHHFWRIFVLRLVFPIYSLCFSRYEMSTGEQEYWTVSRGTAVRFGWKCRECRKDIAKGEPIVARDGRKIRLFYHDRCFSGQADVRTQKNCAMNENRLPKSSFSSTAPSKKGRGKWSVEEYGYRPAKWPIVHSSLVLGISCKVCKLYFQN